MDEIEAELEISGRTTSCNRAADLKILLPVLFGGVFLAANQMIPNAQPVAARYSFLLPRVIYVLLVVYLLLSGSALFSAKLKSALRERAPLFSAVFGTLLVWELVTAKFRLLPLPFFPSPGSVLGVLVADWRTLAISTLYSLRLLGLGYGIGLVVGVPTGVLMGWDPRFNFWLNPVLRFVGPIPATAWIPVAMAVFPTSFAASVFLISLSVWFPVTVMSWSGIANVSKSYYEVARTLGAGEAHLIFKVAVPAAMPNIFVGLFMGMGMAFVTLVVGELLGVKAGLGWYIQWAQGWAEYAKVYAALLLMAVLFSSIITLLFRIRDRLMVWQKGLIKW